ncbi:MAG: hypothetical protein KIG62_05560 [Oscillospiraceae bacterium]|nr:hypothetical protein [Oscillospiraceae bacterium]
MNQEKIMKAKMITATVISITALIAAFIFAGLYYDRLKLNRLAYIEQYEQNIAEAAEEIDKFIEKKTDYELHYNMVLSDLGAARAMIFLVDGKTDEQKAINEIHYCFVKYPEQMREKLAESAQAFHDIADHLDKGYDEVREIVESVDRLGN